MPVTQPVTYRQKIIPYEKSIEALNNGKRSICMSTTAFLRDVTVGVKKGSIVQGFNVLVY